MSEPTRYLARQDGMLSHKDGTWVRLSDYAELQAENAHELDKSYGATAAARTERDQLKAECERLKQAHIDAIDEMAAQANIMRALEANIASRQSCEGVFKRRLDWLLDDYRPVDLWHTIDQLGASDKAACYAAIDAKLAQSQPVPLSGEQA